MKTVDCSRCSNVIKDEFQRIGLLKQYEGCDPKSSDKMCYLQANTEELDAKPVSFEDCIIKSSHHSPIVRAINEHYSNHFRL